MKRLVLIALAAALVVAGAVAGVYVGGAGSQWEAAPVATSPAPDVTAELPAGPSAESTDEAAAQEQPVEETEPAPVEPAVDPRTPERLRLWKFDAPVIPVELEDGDVLVPPDDPQVLGWWGQPAGAEKGTTLLVGHTVSTGGGTFDDLEDTPVGAIARVSGVKYRVERVNVITQEQLANRAERLFDQAGPHKLVLVTCEGWDPVTRTYSENVVVVAKPVQ